MVNVERRSCVVIASLLLAACGGGGGGGSQTPNPNPNPNPGPGTPVNSAPTIETATFTVAEDSDLSVQLTVADADQDTLTLTSSNGPSLGTIVSLSNAGALVYRPNANVSGSDSFDATVSDGRGGTASASVTITITPVDDAPVATNDEFAVTGAQLTSLAVLANDPDADGGTPTLTLEGAALVGTATVNSDNTVRIEGLPADFKGLTRFTYRVAAPQGASSTATAVVFVDTAPFRAVFSLDVDDIDSDLVISDFSGEPTTLVAGGTSAQRLRSYIPSKNGATVAFVRADEDPANEAQTEEICFVKTQGGLAPVCPALRADLRLTNFAISPDGRWIASGLRNLDGTAAASSVHLIDTDNPTGSIIDIADTPYVTDLRFSQDSQYVYFKASDTHDQPALAVYRMDVADPTHSVRMSEFVPASRIVGYVVSNDDSKIILQRSTGDQGFYLVEGDAAGVEYPLSQPITSPDSFFAMSTTPLSQDGNLIAYVFAPSGQDMQLYVADVSTTTPNPRLQYTFPAGTELSALPDIRSDKLAVLISHKMIGDFTTGQVVEQLIDNLAPATPIGSAVTARYADTFDRVVTQRFFAANSGPKRFYVGNRPDFNPPTRLGPAGSTYNLDLSSPEDLYRGAVLAGVSSQNVAEPSTYSPMLMNLSAPTIFFELSVRDVRNSSFLVGDRLHLVDAP